MRSMRIVGLLSVLFALLCIGCGDDGGTGTGPDDGPAVDGSVSRDDAARPSADRSDPAAYVRGDHSSLRVELDVAPGLAPRSGVTELLTGALGELLEKPGGIRVEVDETLDEALLKEEWTDADLRALAEATFDRAGGPDEAVFHTLWLSGSYVSESGGTVLGVAWANRHIALFPETIDAACSSLLPTVRERICREAEAAVWTHEAGHVIGLVNDGIPMVALHEDPEHPGHTTDRDGVMYWSYEQAGVTDLLLARMATGGDRLFQWGPASIADVTAFRTP